MTIKLETAIISRLSLFMCKELLQLPSDNERQGSSKYSERRETLN